MVEQKSRQQLEAEIVIEHSKLTRIDPTSSLLQMVEVSG